MSSVFYLNALLEPLKGKSDTKIYRKYVVFTSNSIGPQQLPRISVLAVVSTCLSRCTTITTKIYKFHRLVDIQSSINTAPRYASQFLLTFPQRHPKARCTQFVRETFKIRTNFNKSSLNPHLLIMVRRETRHDARSAPLYCSYLDN